MNFFENIHEMQITRRTARPRDHYVPHYRRLFDVPPNAREIARAAVREVLD